MRSIIQNEEDRRCYICGCTQGLDVHHTWHGTANRQIADRDGLTVYLCRFCHENLHNKGINDRELMEIGERAWIKETGKTVEEFIKRYGSNVL